MEEIPLDNLLTIVTKSSDAGKTVITYANESNQYKPTAVIRLLDTKHDFDKHYKIDHLLYHFVNDTNIQKSNKNIDLNHGASTLHRLIDFYTDVESETDFEITTNTFNYKVKTPQILPTVKLSSYTDGKSKIEDFIDQIRPTRDCLVYLQGNLDEINGAKEKFQSIMGITENNTHVSKDTCPLNSELIKDIFYMQNDKEYQCYASGLLDPAKEKKETIALENYKYKLIFCFYNKDPVYVIIENGKEKGLNLSFEYKKNKSSGKPFLFYRQCKTPSIMDVVVLLFKKKKGETSAAAVGAEIKKHLSSEKIDPKIETEYLDPIYEKVKEVTKCHTDRNHELLEIVALGLKTIGDQMYLFDAIRRDAESNGQSNIHGSFVVSGDTFLNDYIIHTKSANIFAASKFGRKIPGSPDMYEVCIYLKPLDVKKASNQLVARDQRIKEMNESISTYLERIITTTAFAELLEKYLAVYKELKVRAISFFADFTAVDEDDRYTKFNFRGAAYESSQISQFYYNVVNDLHVVVHFCTLLKDPKIPGLPEGDDYRKIQKCLHSLQELERIKMDAESNLNHFNTIGEKDFFSRYMISGVRTIVSDDDTMRNSLNKTVAVINKKLKFSEIPQTIPVKMFWKVMKNDVNKYFNKYPDNLFGDRVAGGGVFTEKYDSVDIRKEITSDELKQVGIVYENGEVIFQERNKEQENKCLELFELIELYFFFSEENDPSIDKSKLYEDIFLIVSDGEMKSSWSKPMSLVESKPMSSSASNKRSSSATKSRRSSSSSAAKLRSNSAAANKLRTSSTTAAKFRINSDAKRKRYSTKRKMIYSNQQTGKSHNRKYAPFYTQKHYENVENILPFNINTNNITRKTLKRKNTNNNSTWKNKKPNNLSSGNMLMNANF